MELRRLMVVTTCIATMASCATGQDAKKGANNASERQTGSGLPTKFVINEILPQGDGGERTRAFVTAEPDGNVKVNPKGAGAGYRVDMVSSLSSAFSGSIQPTYWFAGAEQLFRGKVSFSGFTFDSDTNYWLTFKLVKGTGFVYLCGRGTVTTRDGRTTRLGYGDGVDTWLPHLASKDTLVREAAAQALGFLATTREDKDRVVPRLIKALDDEAMEVRRNAAEALGRLSDQRAIQRLTSHTDEKIEKDEWVRKVADESLKVLKR